MSGDYLEQFYDPKRSLPAVASREELEGRQIERILRALAVVILAGAIPDRVNSAERELEKKRARRVAHALSNALKGWTKRQLQLPASDQQLRKDAIQLDWDRWLELHQKGVKDERSFLATWAIRTGEHKWGKSAVVKLENELNWVANSLRD